MSAEEVEKHHLSVLGPSAGPVYHAIHNEVIWLHAKWSEFRQLYGTAQERLELLNRATGFFFGVLEDVLWADILLHIARLTDPCTQGKHGKYENLTLRRLPDLFTDPKLKSELNKLLNEVQTASAFVPGWRNRRIAHLELALAVSATAAPLPLVSRQNVEDVLALFRDILNTIRRSCFNDEYSFEPLSTGGGAETLLYLLKFAAQAEEQRMQRHRTGRAIPEDHTPFPKI
jgi:hypothetical protein